MSNIYEKFNLEGRVAVVTGGPGLLGKEFCRTLAEASASVVVVDINGEAATSTAASLAREGYPALGVQTDVTDKDSVSRMVESTLKEFGRLDILVNGAALDPKVPALSAQRSEISNSLLLTFEDYSLELWNQALSVNLTGPFLCCQAAAHPMLEQGQGVIINICSIYGLVGPDQRLYQRDGQQALYKPVDYTVTKAGVLGLTKYLATYYAGKHIRVNALTPGGVFNNHDETFLHAYSARTVLGRMADRDEMNGALLFLASDASAYMTGSNLVVDGGWTTW